MVTTQTNTTLQVYIRMKHRFLQHGGLSVTCFVLDHVVADSNLCTPSSIIWYQCELGSKREVLWCSACVQDLGICPLLVQGPSEGNEYLLYVPHGTLVLYFFLQIYSTILALSSFLLNLTFGCTCIANVRCSIAAVGPWQLATLPTTGHLLLWSVTRPWQCHFLTLH